MYSSSLSATVSKPTAPSDSATKHLSASREPKFST